MDADRMRRLLATANTIEIQVGGETVWAHDESRRATGGEPNTIVIHLDGAKLNFEGSALFREMIR